MMTNDKKQSIRQKTNRNVRGFYCCGSRLFNLILLGFSCVITSSGCNVASPIMSAIGVDNKTDNAITEVYIRSSESPNWGENQLDTVFGYFPIEPGLSENLTVSSGIIDISAEDELGQRWEHYGVTINPSVSTIVEVNNNGDINVIQWANESDNPYLKDRESGDSQQELSTNSHAYETNLMDFSDEEEGDNTTVPFFDSSEETHEHSFSPSPYTKGYNTGYSQGYNWADYEDIYSRECVQQGALDWSNSVDVVYDECLFSDGYKSGWIDGVSVAPEESDCPCSQSHSTTTYRLAVSPKFPHPGEDVEIQVTKLNGDFGSTEYHHYSDKGGSCDIEYEIIGTDGYYHYGKNGTATNSPSPWEPPVVNSSSNEGRRNGRNSHSSGVTRSAMYGSNQTEGVSRIPGNSIGSYNTCSFTVPAANSAGITDQIRVILDDGTRLCTCVKFDTWSW